MSISTDVALSQTSAVANYADLSESNSLADTNELNIQAYDTESEDAQLNNDTLNQATMNSLMLDPNMKC
jgi:hypothetical protein